MRKVKCGMWFVESGKNRREFKIVSISNRNGFSLTNKGTKIRTDRLRSTRHYRVVW